MSPFLQRSDCTQTWGCWHVEVLRATLSQSVVAVLSGKRL